MEKEGRAEDRRREVRVHRVRQQRDRNPEAARKTEKKQARRGGGRASYCTKCGWQLQVAEHSPARGTFCWMSSTGGLQGSQV